MSDKCFLDTNIFVYSFDSHNPSKQKTAKQLIKMALDQGTGCTSYQVVQEFLNVATRKFESPLSTADCQRYLAAVLEPVCEVFSSIGLFHQALELEDRYQYSFYDSLVLAAALQAKCKLLYTEDLQHGQNINKLMITNPFLKE